MIQRIQTVYLALVAVLSILGLCLPIARFYDGAEEVAQFNNFVYTSADELTHNVNLGPLALGIVLVIVVLITLLTIMLFHHRMRQLRLAIFSTILLVGYVAYAAILTWKYVLEVGSQVQDLHWYLSFVAAMPVLSIILNCLAIHAIRKDEALVRSLDRLR